MEPKIKEWQLGALRKFADNMAEYYYGQVYLGGSSLHREDFRDVDVFIIISDIDFYLRFGQIREWHAERNGEKPLEIIWKLSKEQHKRFYEASMRTMLAVDVKILPASFVQNSTYPVYRLDSSPIQIDETWVTYYKEE